MYIARYLADGEMVYDIAGPFNNFYQAKAHAISFIGRMTNPTAQVWWFWVEDSETGKKFYYE